MDPNDLSYRGITVTRAYDLASAVAALPAEQDIDKDSPRPDLARPEVAEMRDAAKLPDALMGGNRRMRRESAEWLQKEEEESEVNYRIRVSRSTCFPFYRDTLLDLAARPFGRDITWEKEPGEGNPGFAEFLRDVDGTGKTLTVFAKDVLFHGMHRGMVHVLVDASSNSGATRETTDGRRVYAQRIDALSMLDIRDTADATGRKRVTYCRFVMRKTLDPDAFAPKHEVVIVELEKKLGDGDGWKLEWRFDTKGKRWVAGAKVAYNPGKNGIPLFTLFTQQTGHYAAEPLLEDLAWVNLAHFQSRSDHAHVMRIARLITLVTLGFPDPESASPLEAKRHDKIVLGPLSRVNSARTPKDVSVSFLEPNGKSIELSFQDMEQLADECKRLGARHLTSKTGNVTARSVSTDDARSVNNLQTFCGRLEVLLRQVCEASAEWLSMGELPADVQPKVNREFANDVTPENGARALQALSQYLSPKQVTIEAVRHRILRPDFPVEDNLKELQDWAKQNAGLDAAIAEAAGGEPDPASGGDGEAEGEGEAA